MSLNVTTIGFDADDTLWHNERFFQLTQARFAGLLSEFCEATDLMEKLLQAEKRNIIKYGFGIKGFVLSIIETALEVTHNEVSGGMIAELIEAGGWGIYVPHGLHWEIEHADPFLDHPRYREIETLAALPDLLNSILKE